MVLAVAVLVALPALLLRFYRLDALPGEFYGDIATVYEYIDAVLKGYWPSYFALSVGPLYGYVAAPLVAIFGQQGYLTYKLITIILSLIGIAFTFGLARRISTFGTALLTGFILSTASWYLVYSRLGDVPIMVPALAAISFYLLARAATGGGMRPAIAGAVVAALGLYTQPQGFVLPTAYALAACFYLPWRKVAALVGAMLIVAVPFAFILMGNRDIFFSSSGYIGEKFGGSSLSSILGKIASNAVNTALMLHVQGSPGFRGNPAGLPQLDPISGVLFLFGLVFWLTKPRRRWAPLIFLPLLMIPIPSILVTTEVIATPSASRTVGIMPFVAVIVAGGLWGLYEWIGRDALMVRRAIVAVLLAAILLINWNRYFNTYADGLPDHNTPYGKIIASQIDALPPGVSAIVVGCCWGQAGQPEPKGIQYILQTPRPVQFLSDGKFVCPTALRRQGAFVVFAPALVGEVQQAIACFGPGVTRRDSDDAGNTIFYTFAAGAALTQPPNGSPQVGPTATVAAALQLPAGFTCAAGAATGQGRAGAMSLDRIPVACGCPQALNAAHAGSWQGHHIVGGIRLTGTCPIAVFHLGHQHQILAGSIYVDDHTGTTGGQLSFFAADAPGDTSTYHMIFDNNIGYEKDRSAPLLADVGGAEYLVIWERCCTAQNTVFDVVATLKPVAAGKGTRPSS